MKSKNGRRPFTIIEINNRKPKESKLTALYYSNEKTCRGGWKVVCICDCGNIKTFEISCVSSGKILSCRCLLSSKKGVSTKYTVLNKYIKACYTGMISRCYNKKDISYKNYGGRGVVVCDEWLKGYQFFLTWALEHGWRKGLQLDKDIKGNGLLYSPSTCIFVTPTVNGNNRRNNRYIILDEKKISLKDACRCLKVDYKFVINRMYGGMSFEDAVKEPKYYIYKKNKNG